MRGLIRSLEELRKAGILQNLVMVPMTSQVIDFSCDNRGERETARPDPLWDPAVPIACESESTMPDRRAARKQCDTLYVEFHRYEDGCVILSGQLKDRYQLVDLHEKYPTGTPAATAFRCLASFLKGWEDGNLTADDLWDCLQVPLNSRRWK